MKERKQSNIERYNEEFRFNKNAFNDVIGDPYNPENLGGPITGQYLTLQKRSSIRVATNDFDSGKATRNTAQPSVVDFICDVDRLISLGLDWNVIEINNFYETYIYESQDAFTPQDRTRIEQKLGKLFRQHKLSPVSNYFKTVRQ